MDVGKLKQKVTSLLSHKSKNYEKSYTHLPAADLDLDLDEQIGDNVESDGRSDKTGKFINKMKHFTSVENLLSVGSSLKEKITRKSHSKLPGWEGTMDGEERNESTHDEDNGSNSIDSDKVSEMQTEVGNGNFVKRSPETDSEKDLGVDTMYSPLSSGFDNAEHELDTIQEIEFDESFQPDLPAEWLEEEGEGTPTSGTLSDEDFKVPLTSHKASRRLSLSAGFELPRFRKRKHNKENDDNISVQSLDVSEDGRAKKKSKRSLLRVSASLVNLISPSRNKNDSDGFKIPSSPHRQMPSPYKPPQPSPAKRRVQRSWVDSVGSNGGKSVLPALSHTDIKRQEAIFELYQGEKDITEDLINVSKMYRDSLVTLNLMSQPDINTLFGNIDELVPVHQDLLARLQGQRKPDGTTGHVGKQVHDWASNLSAYVNFCSNQLQAKSLFDEKKNEPAIDDFFQRCLASPWSRKLDLWTLLDGARGRFVKYPLLIRSILKYTPKDSGDAVHLEKAIQVIESIIRQADEETGLARSEHSKSSLVFLFDEQKVPEIEKSKALLCSGCMKNTKGSKLYVFLYDKVILVSRSTNQNGRQMYQVYRQPIPATDLLVEDLPDGEVKLGSFRNAFGQGGQTAKNLIRISFNDSEKGQAHTLIANDEHDKRQWMQAFHKVTSNILVVAAADSKSKDKQLS